MQLIKIERLELTENEKEMLIKACEILNEIALILEERLSVPWTHYDQDDIWQACELIESFAKNK